MKTIKILLVMFATVLGILNTFAQVSHNYFTSQVYPGLYSRIIFGKNYILFSYPPKQYVKLNYTGVKNGINFYSSNNFTVGVAQNGSFVTTVINGKAVRFNYVGPTSAYIGTKSPSVPSGGNNNSETGRRHKCYFCNQTGKVTKNDHIPQYGSNDYYVYKTCPECGIKYNATITNHYHATCSKCLGKGYIEQ